MRNDVLGELGTSSQRVQCQSRHALHLKKEHGEIGLVCMLHLWHILHIFHGLHTFQYIHPSMFDWVASSYVCEEGSGKK